MDKIVSLSKRRGFVFQSSEIYGGLNGCWDYGPLGVELLRNIKDQWWEAMTYREDIEGIDASILMHPRVWEASGHVANFTDPMVDCKQCKHRFRPELVPRVIQCTNCNKYRVKIIPEVNDALLNAISMYGVDDVIKAFAADEMYCPNPNCEKQTDFKIIETICPDCGTKNSFSPPRKFNLMFKTFVGPVEDEGSVVYLRPETAQGIYVNFLNVQAASRQKLPFGIAQIGKAFRNEINTKNFLFRTREFEQMEMQFFVKPGSDVEWFNYWKEERMKWFVNLGLPREKIQFHQHEPDKLAHYAKDAFDVEYQFPFGWGEIEGIHNRTDYDLSKHEEFSGKSMKYFDEETKERFTPYIIETSAGASRSFMAFLVDAYREEDAPTADGKAEMRVVLKLHPRLAPIKVAVFPLVNRDGMPEIARKIEALVRPHFRVFYDDSGAVGRRYRRQDEAGTPYCVTVDSQTLQDNTVTVRDRDTMQQERIVIDEIVRYTAGKLAQ
jgi:glycyl-tRNA synthetase